MKKKGTGPGARGYQGIVYAITFARELRRRGVTCSQRERLRYTQGRRRVAVAVAGRVQRVDRRRGGHFGRKRRFGSASRRRSGAWSPAS